MRGVWSAIDRSEPKKWRRMVAEHAPQSAASIVGCLQRAPNRSQIESICYIELNRGYLEASGSRRIHMAIEKWSWCRWNARTGPRCAPKCPSFGPPFGRGPNTRLALHFTISTLVDAFFCSSQLASFSVMPVMPWDARGEPMYTLYELVTPKRYQKAQCGLSRLTVVS